MGAASGEYKPDYKSEKSGDVDDRVNHGRKNEAERKMYYRHVKPKRANIAVSRAHKSSNWCNVYGRGERFVDTSKRALLKTPGEGTTEGALQKFLFVYCTNPNPSTPGGISPAKVIMGRKLKTINNACF